MQTSLRPRTFSPVWAAALSALFIAGCARLLPEREGGVDIGYGEVDSTHVSGSVETVRPGDGANERVQTLADMLRTVPGVQVAVSGDDIVIRIRGGASSFLLTGQPLVVVDGMEYRGSLGGLNPAHIRSLRVLKNAGETGVYGAKGANGVILINTKRGHDTRRAADSAAAASAWRR